MSYYLSNSFLNAIVTLQWPGHSAAAELTIAMTTDGQLYLAWQKDLVEIRKKPDPLYYFQVVTTEATRHCWGA